MSSTQKQRYKPGDHVKYQGNTRVVAKVRDTGYTWHYLGAPERSFNSENSSDPFWDSWEEVPSDQ